MIELVDESAKGQNVASELVLAISRFLRERLRWVDVIARWDHSQFLIILPETPLGASNDLLEKVHDGFKSISLPEGYNNTHLTLNIGIAEWQKGYDGRRLMTAASQALELKMEKAST